MANPDPKQPLNSCKIDHNKFQVPQGALVCADIHTHWRAPTYERTWNQFSGPDLNSNWEGHRTGYVATPDAGLLRYDPVYDYPEGSGLVTPVDCSCAGQQ